MYVCREDGEPGARWPRLIGWANVHVDQRQRWLGVATYRAPVRNGPDWDSVRVSPTVTTTDFALRTVYTGGGSERIVLVEGDQDPAILPGWEAQQERISRVFARCGTSDFPLAELSPAEFARWVPPHRQGLPYIYCVNLDGSIQSAPAPTPEYEIIVERERMFSFDPPQREPAYMPVLRGLRADWAIYDEIVAANVLRGDRFNWRVPSIDPETAAASKARARGLLRSLLRPEQWAEFERAGQFSERIGEDEFTITPGGMITRRRGALAEKWCVNPDPHADGNDYMPVEDMAIGQLLHLRADPDKVRATANIFPDGGPPMYGYMHARRVVGAR